MLIGCPECERKVSDRADACPQCGFPIARELAADRAAEERKAEITTRERAGDVDCFECEARGFVMLTEEGPDGVVQKGFSWCKTCEHTGRVTLVRSSFGYFAVPNRKLERFLSGELDDSADRVHALGKDKPPGHRYPQAGKRVPCDDD